jgi:hypothetical protein
MKGEEMVAVLEKVYARPGRGDRKKNRLTHLTAMYFDMEKLRVSQQVRQRHLALDKSPFADDPVFERVFAHLDRAQAEVDRELKPLVKNHPCWTEFSVDVKGVGEHLMALVMGLIRDIEPFTNVSKLWWLCGLAVKDGKAIRPVKGEALNYDPRLKAVLLGRIAPQLLKNQDPFSLSLYTEYYPKEAAKLAALGVEKKWQEVPSARFRKGHHLLNYQKRTVKGKERLGYWYYPATHARSIRKVVKLWVACLWNVWRVAEGLVVTPHYAQQFLGHSDVVTAQRWITFNKNSRNKVLANDDQD